MYQVLKAVYSMNVRLLFAQYKIGKKWNEIGMEMVFQACSNAWFFMSGLQNRIE